MTPLPKPNNIMLDLETMGTSSNAAIVAIGAVRFNTDLEDSFYQVVDLQSSLDAGLEMGADAVLWWMQQEQAARNAITVKGIPLKEALILFTQWAKEDALIWGNGATFDNVILANAYDKSSLSRPWKYSGNRCYRTIKAFYPDIKLVRVGIAHNALDDAQSQALHLINILKEMPNL